MTITMTFGGLRTQRRHPPAEHASSRPIATRYETRTRRVPTGNLEEASGARRSGRGMRRVTGNPAVELAAGDHRLRVRKIEDLAGELARRVDQEEGWKLARQQRVDE